MIAIEKDSEVPPIIYHKARKTAFEKNKAAEKYVSSNNLYKPKKVKTALDDIYHCKCAYCEKTLIDADRHVEHYRPKVPYYWLAFSWDNLLIACKRCNELKSNKFTKYIEGEQLVYNNETLETAQNQIQHYNTIEKPLIINPEQETKESLSKHFTFDLAAGKIIPLTKEMKTTVEVCQLNRKELVELRAILLTRLKNHLQQDLATWSGENEKEERARAMISTIKKFKKEIIPQVSFIAWRAFIFENWKVLFQNLQG